MLSLWPACSLRSAPSVSLVRTPASPLEGRESRCSFMSASAQLGTAAWNPLWLCQLPLPPSVIFPQRWSQRRVWQKSFYVPFTLELSCRFLHLQNLTKQILQNIVCDVKLLVFFIKSERCWINADYFWDWVFFFFFLSCAPPFSCMRVLTWFNRYRFGIVFKLSF